MDDREWTPGYKVMTLNRLSAISVLTIRYPIRETVEILDCLDSFISAGLPAGPDDVSDEQLLASVTEE